MNRRALVFGALALGLTACGQTASRIGPDGLPLPQIYQIKPGDEGDVQYRFLDSVNSLRAAAGLVPLTMSAQLNAAAATHSRDMALQNRPWHFGSDGSSPLQRAQRVGYTGRILGENISETYETELETLAAWLEQADTRDVVMDRAATEMGFSWYQEPNGKIWWTFVTGSGY